MAAAFSLEEVGDSVRQFMSKDISSLFIKIIALEKLVDGVDAAKESCQPMLMRTVYREGPSLLTSGWYHHSDCLFQAPRRRKRLYCGLEMLSAN